MRSCIIIGDPDRVQEAVRTVEGIMAGNRPGGAGPPPDAYQIRLPADRIGLVIGKGGENIRALEKQSGARMTVDNLNGATARERTVFVSASSPQIIAYAEQLVYAHIGETPPYAAAVISFLCNALICCL